MIGSPIRTQGETQALLRVPRPVVVAPVPATAGIVLAARTDADYHVTGLHAVNVTGLAATLTLHIVPAGGSVAAGNAILWAQSIAGGAREILFTDAAMVALQPGEALHAVSDTASAINVYGFGYDYQGQYSA